MLSYISRTINYGLFYTHSENCSLSGYTSSDYAGSLDDRKSTSGYVFHLGTNLISWASKKQLIISISLAKEKYVVVSLVACQTLWIRRLFQIFEMFRVSQLLTLITILQFIKKSSLSQKVQGH